MAPVAFLVAFLALAAVLVATLLYLVKTAVDAEWDGLLQTVAAQEEALRAVAAAPGAAAGTDLQVVARLAEGLREAPDLVTPADLAALEAALAQLLLQGRALPGHEGLLALHGSLARQIGDYNRWALRFNHTCARLGMRPRGLVPRP